MRARMSSGYAAPSKTPISSPPTNARFGNVNQFRCSGHDNEKDHTSEGHPHHKRGPKWQLRHSTSDADNVPIGLKKTLTTLNLLVCTDDVAVTLRGITPIRLSPSMIAGAVSGPGDSPAHSANSTGA